MRLVFFSQTLGCDACLPARQVLDEVARWSDRVSVVEYNLILDKDDVAKYGVDRVPATVVVGASDVGLRYYGVPSGHELTTLVDAIVIASEAGVERSGLSTTSLELLGALDRPVDIKVFVTPTCRFCPQAASLAYRLAAASPHVSATVVDATEFPDLVRRYRVSGVPKTVVDDRIEILGAQPEEVFVKEALQASAAGPPA